MPAGPAEQHTGGADPLGGPGSALEPPTRGWQGQADFSGQTDVSLSGHDLSGVANGGPQDYGNSWDAPRGEEPAPTTWQPPPEDIGETAGWAGPFNGMPASDGGAGTSNGGYGGSPLELSPPSIIEPDVGLGAGVGADAANEWHQTGTGPGVSSIAVGEDEMVELDF